MNSECFLAGTGAAHKVHMIFLKSKLIYIPDIFLQSECPVKLPPGYEKESKRATSSIFEILIKNPKREGIKIRGKITSPQPSFL